MTALSGHAAIATTDRMALAEAPRDVPYGGLNVTSPRSGAMPELVLAAHGSAVAAGRSEIEKLTGLVAQLLPEVAVRVGWLGHALPRLAETCRAESIVVPLLLGHGYHAGHDVPAAALPARARVTAPIAGHPAVLDALAARLDWLEVPSEAPVVLAAAGSREEGALTEVRSMASRLSARRQGPVIAAFATAAPSVGQVLAAFGQPAAVLTYLLAPGRLAGEIEAAARLAGAGWLSPPFGADPNLGAAVVGRYREELGRRDAASPRRAKAAPHRLAGSTTPAPL